MNYYNHMTIIGRLCRVTPAKQLGPDQTVAEFGVALNDKYRDKSGESKEKTTYVDCQAWNSRALTITDHVKIGDVVCLSGQISQDRWEKDGQKRSRTYMIVTNIVLLNTERHAPQQTPQPAPEPTSTPPDMLPF